jgi:hypothetical protein
MSATPPLGHWPGERHAALLHAALDEGSAAVEAWKRWRQAVDFDESDGPEQRLLPLAYANLGERIASDPDYGRAKGIYRRAWTHNQLLFNRAAPALEALREAGIETMLLKGAPLALLHYPSLGARPMADVDVLVGPGRAADAMRVLRDRGWAAHDEPGEQVIRFHHSHDFGDGGMGHLDLHWFSLWESSSDAPLWERSRPLTLAGVPSLAPDPADLLLIVSAHGSPRDPVPAFRWVADAAAICRTAPVDWDRLVAESHRRNLRVAAAATMGYLRREFGVEVPADVLSALDAERAPRWERAAFRAQTAPSSPWRTLQLLRTRHRRMRMIRDEAPWHPGFLAFAQAVWGFERTWELPAHALRRLAGFATGRREGEANRAGVVR